MDAEPIDYDLLEDDSDPEETYEPQGEEDGLWLAIRGAIIAGGIVNISLTLEQYNLYQHSMVDALHHFQGHPILLVHISAEEPVTAIVFDLPAIAGEGVQFSTILVPTDQVEPALLKITQIVSTKSTDW